MLYWTMLAACTVGPGTVVTCARAEAEYDLSLICDAILAIPGLTNTNLVRIGSCVAYASVALALLYWDKVDMLGMFLGIVMMCMVALFFVVVVVMGLDMKL